MAVTAAQVRALEGAVIRHATAGGSGSMGDAVYYASDGDVEQCDADLAVSSEFAGLVVAVADQGETAFVAGDAVTIVTHGPVGGFSSLTPGGKLYLSETPGQVTHTPPSGGSNWVKTIGYAESASVVYVDPDINDASSTSA